MCRGCTPYRRQWYRGRDGAGIGVREGSVARTTTAAGIPERPAGPTGGAYPSGASRFKA